MPLIDDILIQFGQFEYFYAFDMWSGFWQIWIVHGDIKKITIIIKYGLFNWIVMSFGLKNTTNTFTQTMIDIFQEWMQQFLKVFVDNLNVHNVFCSEHLKHLNLVLARLREVNFKFNLKKCVFTAKHINFLGHVISKKMIMMIPCR